MSKPIPLTQNTVAIVDDADYGWLMQWKWYRHDRYAAAKIGGKEIYMHKLILGIGSEAEGDHINGNTFDNRRANLRVCTHLQNMRNRKQNSNATSRFKGVFWRPDRGKWRAKIRVNRKHIYLGLFASDVDAARAYDAAAREYFGEFARLNFPKE